MTNMTLSDVSMFGSAPPRISMSGIGEPENDSPLFTVSNICTPPTGPNGPAALLVTSVTKAAVVPVPTTTASIPRGGIV